MHLLSIILYLNPLLSTLALMSGGNWLYDPSADICVIWFHGYPQEKACHDWCSCPACPLQASGTSRESAKISVCYMDKTLTFLFAGSTPRSAHRLSTPAHVAGTGSQTCQESIFAGTYELHDENAACIVIVVSLLPGGICEGYTWQLA